MKIFKTAVSIFLMASVSANAGDGMYGNPRNQQTYYQGYGDTGGSQSTNQQALTNQSTNSTPDNIGTLILSGAAILGLALLATSGDSSSSDNGEVVDECSRNPNYPGCSSASHDSPSSYQSSPEPLTSGFYGNCHGGAFYGCPE